MRSGGILERWPSLLAAPLGAFSSATICWFVWGFYFTPGDYFANGSRWVNPTLVLALLVGGGLAYLGGRWTRLVVIAISLLCAAFWISTPDGWWATPPAWWPLGG